MLSPYGVMLFISKGTIIILMKYLKLERYMVKQIELLEVNGIIFS